MSCYSPVAVVEYYLRSNLSCDIELLQAVYFLPPTFPGYVATFLMTVAIEAPLYILLGKLSRARWPWIFFCLFACNLATHPTIHFLLIPYANEHGWRTLNFILVAETFAAVTECILAWWIFKSSWWKTFILIVAANLISWSFS